MCFEQIRQEVSIVVLNTCDTQQILCMETEKDSQDSLSISNENGHSVKDSSTTAARATLVFRYVLICSS
jgi:hypothetical protein